MGDDSPTYNVYHVSKNSWRRSMTETFRGFSKACISD